MNNNTVRSSITAVPHTDVRRLPTPSSLHLDVSNDEWDEMRVLIDDAVESVGLVLETALQALTNLHAARAALLQSDAARPSLNAYGQVPDA